MSNDLFKRNCAVLSQWYAGECKEVLQVNNHGMWEDSQGCIPHQYEYRIKPRTITVNGIEVPEPVREPLKDGEQYWAVCLGEREGVKIQQLAGQGIRSLIGDQEYGKTIKTNKAAVGGLRAEVAC